MLFTIFEVAAELKVHTNTVRGLIKRGDLKASRVGRQLRIREEDLKIFLSKGAVK